MKTRGSSRFSRRAAIMTQAVIFGSAVGLGVAALAVDTGLMYASKQELQNAADSAALAAASQLGSTVEATALAIAEGAAYANLNEVTNMNVDLVTSDVVLGHAVMNGNKFDFQPNQAPYDAVRVTLRRDTSVSDGPVSLVFGKALGLASASIQASAVAMLMPRDIAVVIDLSGSMNDDSEFRHHKDFDSETPGAPDRPGVQINLRDIWCSLNGPEPARPYMPGDPDSTEYAGDTGPTWGQMNNWGSDVRLGEYDATTDAGLWYLKSGSNTTDAAILSQLSARNYKTASSSSPSTMSERDCLTKGTKDGSYANNFINRTKVILGLAEWRSGKSNSKYGAGVGGDADDKVEDNELTAVLSYPSGMSGGSWNDYLSYVASSSSEMENTDTNLRYRHGLKTFVNYLLEKRSKNSQTPQLAGAPELPIRSVKDAVQTMIDTIIDLETQDHCSLEVFATTGQHEIDLTVPGAGEELSDLLQEIPETLYDRQAGHYDNTTCIGCGLEEGVTELTSERARSAASKVIILLSDGKPNVSGGGTTPEGYAIAQAEEAAEMGMTIYTIGVGGDANDGFLEDIAEIGHGEYFFADNAPDPSTGVPQYVEQLQEIFQTLGGRRPVRLIQ